MQLVYRLAFSLCGFLAFCAAVTACSSGNISLTAGPTPSFTPGPILYSPSAITLSVSQANTVNLVLQQVPGNPANGIGTPAPLWPPKTDTCTNVFTVNGVVQNQSYAVLNSYTTALMIVNNIQGKAVGSCNYVITDGSNDGIKATISVTVKQ